MNRNVVNHKILYAIIKYLGDRNLTRDNSVDSDTIYNEIKCDEELFDLCLTYLATTGYLVMNPSLSKDIHILTIHEKGVSAATGKYFLHENKKERRELFRDVCTLIVAAATVYALYHSIKQSKDDSIRLLNIQQQVDSLKLRERRVYQLDTTHRSILFSSKNDTIKVRVVPKR